MKYFTYFLLLSAAALFYACNETVTHTDVSSTIQGYIIDANDNPIEGMQINAINIDNVSIDSDTTNSEGFFLLKNLPDSLDNINIVMVHPEYKYKIISALDFIASIDEEKHFKFSDKFLEGDCCNQLEVNVKNENDEPLDDVEVRLNKGEDVIGTLYTDSDGYVEFDSLCDGNYWIRVYHSDYNVKEIEFSLDDCDSLVKNVVLTEKSSCCNFVKFTVYNSQEETINNAEIKLRQNGNIIGVKFTNENGVVEFDSLCDGGYDFRVYKEGYLVKEDEFGVDDCEEKEIDVILLNDEEEDCCNEFILTVLDNEENPVNEAKIRLYKGEQLIGTQYSNDNGKAVFDSLCDGNYWVKIEKEGFSTKNIEFGVDNCEEVTETVLLQSEGDCCNEFILTVLDNEENPVNEAKIRLYKGEQLIGTQYSNDNGKAAFDSLCDGNYWVKIEKEGFSTKNIEFGVDNCEEATKTVLLQSEGDCCNEIKIIVKDEDNNRVENAQIKLQNDEYQEIKYSNGDGVAIFDSLCDGRYQVRIYKEGYNVKEYIIEVDNCESKVEDFVLIADKCCDNILRVFPKDSETGEMITNAKVRLWQGGDMIEQVFSGENGAVIDGICEGGYWVDIIAEGYESIEFEVSFDCDEVKEIVKELIADDDCCDGSIKLFVKDSESGEYITSGYIKLWKNGEMLREKEINNDGFVYINELCDGEYGIDIFVEGYQHKEFAFNLDCNENKEITKEITPEICCDNKAIFIPKDSESGEIINGAIVKLWKNGDIIRQKTVEGGSAIMYEICKGNYVVSISAENYESIEFEVSFDCDEEKEFIKEMQTD